MTKTRDDDQAPSTPAPAERLDGKPGEETALALYNAGILDAYPGAREQFMALLDQVPEPDDNASARIVMAILGSEDPEQLDAAWEAEGMRDYLDHVIRVKDIVKMPSAYTTGLGCFLVCQVDEPHIGEEFIVTTGSVAIVAQLVKAKVAGWLPLEVVPKQSERPSRNGYFPMHLEMVRRRARKRAVVIDQPSPSGAVATGQGAAQ